MSRYDLTGKVFFVTGGAGGIGRGVIEGLLDNQAKVFFIDIDVETGTKVQDELVARYGSNSVRFGSSDVTDRQKFEETFNQAVELFGHVDVMFNNAGIVSELTPKQVIDINLLGCIYGTEIAAAHMRKDQGGRGGRIINMSSSGAGLEDMYNVPTYCATKQGVRSFTISHSMSPHNEGRGLEYAVLHPGRVATGMFSKLKEEEIFDYEGLMKAIKGTTDIPLSRIVEGFLALVTLEEMNGAMLEVLLDSMSFVRMEKREIGSSYPSVPPPQ